MVHFTGEYELTGWERTVNAMSTLSYRRGKGEIFIMNSTEHFKPT